MGTGSFNMRTYEAFTSSTVGKSTEQIYESRKLDDSLDPYGVKLRESRDSADNPQSTPVIVGIDVTGSMGMLADVIAREGLGTLFEAIFDRKPITDPHVMFMAIGDATCDSAPLQVSQFEADNRIVDQLTKIYIEHRGGGNNFESYNLPWYFSAFHTEHDAYQKRGKRGYLFTLGDEEVPDALTQDQIKRVCGDDIQRPLSSPDLLEMAKRYYDCYHIIIEEGSYARHSPDRVGSGWRDLMGQHAIQLSDHKRLAETIVSIIEVAEGAAAAESAAKWGGRTAEVVGKAVKDLPSPAARPQLGRDTA